jgi:hypothetical protein
MDLGDMKISVPEGWTREDLDAGWWVVQFGSVDAGAGARVLRHPVGELWENTFSGLVDAGWQPDDASAYGHATFTRTQPAVMHEIVRIFQNRAFLVGITCQYLDDSARARCDAQFDRLDLDVAGSDAAARGYRFLSQEGWHRVDEPQAQVALEADDGPEMRVLVTEWAVPPASQHGTIETYRSDLPKTPGVTVKGDRSVTYRGRPGIEHQLDTATYAVSALHVATFELPGGQAIVSCQGPANPELALTCETLLGSVSVPSDR